MRLSPSELIKHCATTDRRLPALIYSDQLMAPADASVLVRTQHGDAYFSALEFILSANYGYSLHIWTTDGDLTVRPGTTDIAQVLEPLAQHLRSCHQLGETWLMRARQHERTVKMRDHNARRKLRLFKSIVFNAFRDAPDSPRVPALLARIERIESSLTGNATS